MKTRSTGLNLRELKYKKTPYPQSPLDVLPRQFFTLLALGPRGSGKTYSVCQLLKEFERHPPENPDGTRQEVRTIVISPTYDANECFRALKSLDEDVDVHITYSPKVLQDILDDLKEIKKEREKYVKELEVYKKYQRTKNGNRLSLEELGILERLDYNHPEEPDYPNGVSTFLVIDDMVGSSIFKSGSNPFVNLLLRNRHHGINVIIMTQSLKSIPRSIRGNISVFMCFRFGARQFLPDLYEEAFSGELSYDEFERVYDEATSGPHDCLVLDTTKPKGSRLLISWREYIEP
jgi:hypothetical protein